MNIRDIILACRASKQSDDFLSKPVSAISIDTRTLQVGDLYVAIQGGAKDGHDYVSIAKEKGAVAAVVSRTVECDIPQIIVPETSLALGQIAAYWRQKFSIPIIAITGSSGKTTTRNMVASILIQAFGQDHVLVPEKNLNNHWGLPLVLSRLNAQHKIAVLELGMNHLEEIRYLMKIAQPTIGLITNAGSNHIGFLGSLENIAKAKGEMFEELPLTSTAVLNADDRFFSYWNELLKTQKKYLFGSAKGDFYAEDISAGTFGLVTPVGRIDVRRVLLGQHNIVNAVSAAASVFAAGILDLSIIKAGLEKVCPEPGRLELIVTPSGVTLLNDTYNGGEASILSALQVLRDYPARGKKIAVIGDMSELGEFEISMHTDMGENIMRFSPDIFIAFGPLMEYAYQIYSGNKEHFLHHEDVVLYLRSLISQGDVILFKGSRAMVMENILDKLR